MPGVERSPRRYPTRSARVLPAGACLLLGLASLAHFEHESRLRAAAARFAQEFAVVAGSPDVARAMTLQPAGDLACDVVVEAALRDPAPGAGGTGKSETRAAGAAELRAARELMLDAMAERPGWPYHRLYLARTVLSTAGEAAKAEATSRSELSVRLFARAAAEAPGLDASWVGWGRAILQEWPEISPALRAKASPVLRRAFLSADFVSTSLPAAVRSVGRTAALSLLPDNPYLLRVAIQTLSRDGDLDAASLLTVRRDEVERRKRAADLLHIERCHQRRDVDALQAACDEWLSKHPAGDFDDALGRSQNARVLELWPEDDGGSWRDDPRAILVRFFLDGREAAVPGRVLLRSLDPLSDVPDLILARAKLLAGDRDGAEELARGTAAGEAANWTSYYNDLARFDLAHGNLREARNTLEQMTPESRARCDVLLTRRDVARALGDAAEVETANQILSAMRMRSHSAEPAPGSSEAALALCVDPAWASGRRLTVEVEVAAPALLSYGWDGGRAGTVAAKEASTVWRTPLAGVAGSRSFFIRTHAGGPIREIRAAVEETGS